MLDDNSLLIKDVSDQHGGIYTIVANNGIGEAQSNDMEVIIYPVVTSISMVNEKITIKPKTDVTIECKIRGEFCKFQITFIQQTNFHFRLSTTYC